RLPTVFFFNALSPSLIYTLSLHDALPISPPIQARSELQPVTHCQLRKRRGRVMNRNRYSLGLFAVAVLIACGLSPCVGFGSSRPDRKSTRLNSSHQIISYAVFCLKKKKKK